jgi:geranylgeranyl diphosphate synthase, type II
MQTINDYLECINKEIERSILSKKLQPFELYEPINYILNNGGKRIRALFVLIGNQLFGGNIAEVVPSAIGVEVFHNFTLLHDDIMDKADIRRGKPTVHKKWNENTAILSGDAMMIIAQQFINKTPLPILQKVNDVFLQTAIEVCEGQQYDVNLEHIDISKQHISEDDYINMIRLKTSVLIAASFKIGALIANASDIDAQKIYDYGLNIGLAFQIQDDLLDSFGNESDFGKKIGGDIMEGKKTYLLVKALELSNPNQKEVLLNLINRKEIKFEEKVATIKSIYSDLNIQNVAQQKLNHILLKQIKY